MTLGKEQHIFIINIMKPGNPYQIIVLLIILCSCNRNTEWVNITYNKQICDTITTACITTHQGTHDLQKCNIYMDGDTLFISFPPELPAYWGSMKIRVYDGRFSARFDGVPFNLTTMAYETVGQELVLGRKKYAIGDTLCGSCSITFRESDLSTGQKFLFNIRGTISETVRDRNFNPFLPENRMAFDLPTAIHELGEPLDRVSFSTCELPGFRVELLNFFPANENIMIEELTWNPSDTRDISDESKERLTIWYARVKDKKYFRNASSKLPPVWSNVPDSSRWLPVHFMEWTTDEQF